MAELSKPEILRQADAQARKQGSILSFRRFCPDLALQEKDDETGEALDEKREQQYYTWLASSGIYRALINDPGWCEAYNKALKEKKITKDDTAELRTAIALEDEPIRNVLKDHVEELTKA